MKPNEPARPGPPPYAALRAKLLEQAEALRDSGHVAEAASLAAVVERWWDEQLRWNGSLVEMLRLHHDINNALVGVSGNAQLLMRDPVADQPGVRERLEVMVRESNRIQTAAARLRDLKSALEGNQREPRAA